MDLIELTRTIQADREREIESSMRVRRLLARPTKPASQGWRQRWLGHGRTHQRASSGTVSR
jgi:hypothetical protein